MISSLKVLIRYLPELITIIRGITKMIADAEEKAAQKKAANDIKEAFKTGDPRKLNDVFNRVRK